MCPICVANAALTATGAASAGGFSVFVARIFHGRIRRKKSSEPLAVEVSSNSPVEGEGK
jgi:hypothetical protein